jgi:hypothetical protein
MFPVGLVRQAHVPLMERPADGTEGGRCLRRFVFLWVHLMGDLFAWALFSLS